MQEFFAAWLRDDFFCKADPNLGRYRNFLLSALKPFVANARRAALAKKRHPAGGFAFIDDSAFAEEHRSDSRAEPRGAPRQTDNDAPENKAARRSACRLGFDR